MSTGRKGRVVAAGKRRTFPSRIFSDVGCLVLLTLSLGSCPAKGAANTDAFENEKNPPEVGLITRMRRQEESRKKQAEYDVKVAIPDIDVAEKELDRFNNTVSNAMKIAEQTRRADEASGGLFKSVCISAVLLGVGIVLFRLVAPNVGRWLIPWTPAIDPDDATSTRQAEEKSFLEFATAFKVGPTAGARAGASGFARAETSLNVEEKSYTVTNPLKEFFDCAPKATSVLRNLLQEITRTTDELVRQKSLVALCEKLEWLKGKSALPEVLPVWQMSAALEGLVKQLIQKPKNVTPSTLRTIASALDLLETLCLPNVRPDLAANPPIRLLAVDDDAIGRHAVSLALRKAFNKPDLAENGEAALALASQIQYDAIFLDVQMPGMDGFEACKKIHATEINRTTPVVFVTWLGDFDARAKSTLSGGNDLIGKPFLTFEITVKALTLAFRGRLVPRHERNEKSPASVAEAAELSSDVVMKAFLAHAPEHVQTLRKRLEQVEAASEEIRQEQLVDLYLAVHSIRAEAELANFRVVVQLSSAVEARLKSVIEDKANCSSTSLEMIGEAFDVLGDVLASRQETDLAKKPAMENLEPADDLDALVLALKNRLKPQRQESISAIAETLPVPDLVAAGK
jgi:CheY-like chemotaxis protein